MVAAQYPKEWRQASDRFRSRRHLGNQALATDAENRGDRRWIRKELVLERKPAGEDVTHGLVVQCDEQMALANRLSRELREMRRECKSGVPPLQVGFAMMLPSTQQCGAQHLWLGQ